MQKLKLPGLSFPIINKINKETMKLHIKDRLYILQLLPETGNFMEYSLKRAITNKVAITTEEQTKYEFKEVPEENKIIWNSEKDFKEPVEITFTTEELNYIRKGCEALVETPKPDDFWYTVEKIYNQSES